MRKIGKTRILKGGYFGSTWFFPETPRFVQLSYTYKI